MARHKLALEKFLAKYSKDVENQKGVLKTKESGQLASNFKTPLSEITNTDFNTPPPSSKNTTVAPDTDEQISLDLKRYRKSLFQDPPSTPVIFSTPWRM